MTLKLGADFRWTQTMVPSCDAAFPIPESFVGAAEALELIDLRAHSSYTGSP